MKGGRILGEGVDGCIFTEPMWPCAAESAGSAKHPDPRDSRFVSKVVHDSDVEIPYLEAAQRILGASLSNVYIAGLRTKCKPADRSHPPLDSERWPFKASETDLQAWAPKYQACGILKETYAKAKAITQDHSIMVIQRYPNTIDEWAEMAKRDPKKHYVDMSKVLKAIPPLLMVLQKLYKDPSEQLINLDLHTGNVFVRETREGYQFGLADFGHCLLRRFSDPETKQFNGYMGKYLKDMVNIDFYNGYSQIPLEARLLNYCFRKGLDRMEPKALCMSWLSLKEEPAISLNTRRFLEKLFVNPVFLAMVVQIQQISYKLRNKSASSFTGLHIRVLEFIVTRYMCWSPINTLTDAMATFLPSQSRHLEVLRKYLYRLLAAPYVQGRMSLEDALSAIESADVGLIWEDVIAEL